MKKRTQSSSKGVSYVSRNFVKLCLLWIFSLSSLMIQAQDNQRISVDLRGESLESTLWYLQNRTKFIFMYATEDIANITDISVRAKNKTITEILDECLEGTNLTYEVSGTAIVIKKRKTNKITISGWIRDASGEALPGATVTVRGSKHGAIAGLDGHYTFNILINDFEASVFPQHPVIGEIKRELYHQGAIYASMSGSGSSVFGLFAPGTSLPETIGESDVFCFKGKL